MNTPPAANLFLSPSTIMINFQETTTPTKFVEFVNPPTKVLRREEDGQEKIVQWFGENVLTAFTYNVLWLGWTVPRRVSFGFECFGHERVMVLTMSFASFY